MGCEDGEGEDQGRLVICIEGGIRFSTSGMMYLS